MCPCLLTFTYRLWCGLADTRHCLLTVSSDEETRDGVRDARSRREQRQTHHRVRDAKRVT